MLEQDYTYVSTIALTGNLSRASELLFISPSALSKALARVEAECGVALFDRIGKQFVLTDAGILYTSRAKEILEIQQELHNELSLFAAQKKGLLRIGIQLTTDITIIRLISQFREEYPGIHLHIVEDTSMRLCKMLTNGQLDILLVNADEMIQGGFHCQPLAQNEVVFVMRADHPAIKRAVWKEGRKYPVISSKDLCGESLIIQTPEQRMGIRMEEVIQSYGIQAVYSYRASSVRTMLHLAAAGLGIAVAYDHTALPYEDKLHLRILAPEKQTTCSIVLLTNPKRQLSEAANRLIELIQAEYIRPV